MPIKGVDGCYNFTFILELICFKSTIIHWNSILFIKLHAVIPTIVVNSANKLKSTMKNILSDSGKIMPSDYKIYKIRWYILMIFSLLSFQQCYIWQTFGPIERSVRYAYSNWTEDTVVIKYVKKSCWKSSGKFYGIEGIWNLKIVTLIFLILRKNGEKLRINVQ